MGNLAAIRREVREQWPAIVARARMPHAAPHLPKSPKLFGQSHKVDLGMGEGVATRVVYLAPADAAMPEGDARTVCPFATAGCRAVCLGEHTGLLVTSTAAKARLWKTALYFGSRRLFRAMLAEEAAAHVRACERDGKVPALRVDGSSDTAEGAILARTLGERGLRAEVYDYTKNVAKALANARGEHPAGYHVTFSYSGENEPDCKAVLAAGGVVAAAFDTPRGEALPAEWWGHTVTDADLTDARFRDPRGTVAGLRFKTARNRAEMLDRAGAFVLRVSD